MTIANQNRTRAGTARARLGIPLVRQHAIARTGTLEQLLAKSKQTTKPIANPPAEIPSRWQDTTALRLETTHRWADPTIAKTNRFCGRTVIESRMPTYSEKGMNGVARCQSSLCAYCGKKRAMDNCRIVRQVVEQTRDSFSYFMGTLTFSTDTTITKQVQAYKTAMGKALNSIQVRMKKRGLSFSLAWQFDFTYKKTGLKEKAHIHAHYIARIEKNSAYDDENRLGTVIFESWSNAVKKHTDRSINSQGFHNKRMKTDTDAGIRYLFKAIKEVSNSVMKTRHKTADRIGYLELLDEIGNRKTPYQVRDRMVASMNETIRALKGLRLFAIPKTWKEGIEFSDETETETETDRVIEPISTDNEIHSAIARANALPVLVWVLKNLRDGDGPVEDLRAFCDYWKGQKRDSDRVGIEKDFREWKTFTLEWLDEREKTLTFE